MRSKSTEKSGRGIISSYFLLYRKLRKLAKMVYNGLEIKNGITKERRCDFAMTLSMQFFVFWFRLHDLTVEKE